MANAPKRKSARSARLENIARGLYRFRSNRLSMLGLLMLVFILLVAIFAPFIAPFPEDAAGKTHVTERLLPPSAEHYFGTDKVGRDIFSRVVMGTGLALQVGTVIILLATTIGVTIGAIAGYAGGWVDDILMRITDIFLTVPALVLAIAISAALGKGIINAMLGISLVWWPGFARLTLSRRRRLSAARRGWRSAVRTVPTAGRVGWAVSGAAGELSGPGGLRRGTVQTAGRVGWAVSGAAGDALRAGT